LQNLNVTRSNTAKQYSIYVIFAFEVYIVWYCCDIWASSVLWNSFKMSI